MNPASASAHPRRRPINWAADDVCAALAHKAPPLRDLIEHYRSRVLAQRQRLMSGAEALARNPYSREAINPTVERARLRELQDVLHYLLHLQQQLPEEPPA